MKRLPTDWTRSVGAGVVRAAILRFGFAPLLAAELDVRIEGRELLGDVAGPAIFVANHSSHLDAPLVLTSLPAGWRDRIAVGAAADYFFDVWWKAAATALAFNAFAVERETRGRPRGMARRLLAEGWSLLVFPEGTRSRDGAVAGFRKGAAMLAVDAGVPVVPVAIRGAYQAMPPGASWPAAGRPRVTVRFGRARRPARGESAVSLNRWLEAELGAMLEEDRTSWWQARRAARPGSAERIAPKPAEWRCIWQSSEPLVRGSGPWAADAGTLAKAPPLRRSTRDRAAR
jgi:1-acyl-sn-glycerol-3-phosphate acyltransferase